MWVNGQSAVKHSGGHLPFEADITPFIQTSTNYSKVRIVVSVNTTLTPQHYHPQAVLIYFNYGGIDHSVLLYSTSSAYIEDIGIDTQSINYDSQKLPTSATLNYSVTIGGTYRTNVLQVLVQLLDADGIIVANSTNLQSTLIVNKPHLWEPCGMNHTHACTEQSYSYTLQVTLSNGTSKTDILDIYRVPHIGIRTIRLTNSMFLVNERPFHFHGANAHEDSEIRGKGFDNVLITKYFNLFGWLHGNSFRTSHYPYAEEYYYMADRYGVAIIDEVPATGFREPQYSSRDTLALHKEVITAMINRDRNHPSVLMWSLANEPEVNIQEANVYFSKVFNFTRPIAAGRPVIFVTNMNATDDLCVELADVICINRYYGWRSFYGRLDQVPDILSQDIASYRQKYPNKPLMVSEFGAETLSGLHNDPPIMFTEEYQKEFYAIYHTIFDNYSSILHPETGYFIGELVWNMFDFAHEQATATLDELNSKGLFSRERHFCQNQNQTPLPEFYELKAAAFLIKNRYEQLELIPTPSLETTD